jgi:hypothetical protein
MTAPGQDDQTTTPYASPRDSRSSGTAGDVGEPYYGGYFDSARDTRGSSSSVGSCERLSVSPDTYIVRDGEDLWLIMGNVKAKLATLIYEAESSPEPSPTPYADKNSLALPIISYK